MIETPISFLQIDTPGANAVLPPGRHAIQGWLMPKLRGGFADLRLRVGSRIIPGALGFLRRDLAHHFQTGRPHETAGFQLNVELAPGTQHLVFEALQVEGVWQEVGTLDVVVDAALAPVDFAVPSAPVRGREFGHLLRSLLTTAASPQELGARAQAWVTFAPFPRDVLQPKSPFHGALREPEAITVEESGFITLSGHLFHAALRVQRLWISTDLQVMQPLSYGEPSPNVAERYPRFSNARACGFSGRVFVPSQLPNPIALRLYAELIDGTHHLVMVARTWRETPETLSAPFSAKASSSFDEAVTTLRRALADHRLALVTDAVYEQALTRLRRALTEPAPKLQGPALIELETTFTHAQPEARRAWGLPPEGLIVAGLVPAADSVYAHALAQAAQLLRERHPALAPDVTFILTGTGSTKPSSPDFFALARPLSEDEALTLADLTIRPADRGAEAMPAGDTVALAEALAHRLYRHCRSLSETKAAP